MSIAKTKGVDISSHNGNIDLAKVKKAGYKWVMIRCGFGDNIKSQDDSQFEANVKKAEALGMPWGVYFYTYSLNAKQDKSELEHILRLLKGKKPTLPIAIDVEDADGYKRKNGGWNYANVNRNTKYLLEGVKKAGYYPILYTGFEEIENLISKEVSGRYDVWFAHWAKKCGYTGKNLAMWQYGGETNLIDGNSIPGVGTIDKDIVYKDYPTIIKNGGYNGWTKPKTTSKPKKEVKVLDSKGFKKGDKSIGVLALKQLLFLAQDKKIVTAKMNNDQGFGGGTEKAVNQVLKKLGYKQNGIAGAKFIKALRKHV